MSTVEQLVEFFRSDYWAENEELLHRPDVTLHEVMLATRIHPLALEFLFHRYLKARDKNIINVGHAVVGHNGLIKFYTSDRPSFFLMWRYDPDVLIGPDPDGSIVVLDDEGERSYLESLAPRRLQSADRATIDAYFESEHWYRMLAKMRDPDIEHFHAFLLTDIHPYDLAEPFTAAMERAGYGRLDPYYLARPDIGSMWLGYVPPGTTSMEFVATHTPGVVLEPQMLSDADRAYGGDGFTVIQLKRFIDSQPYEVVTLGEMRAVLKAIS